MTAALRTRPPTNRAPWPLVLIDGEPKTGKTYAAVQFAASPRVGMMYGFDMGEGSLDEYGSLADGKLLIVEHDGSYRDLQGQMAAAMAEPRHDPARPNAILLDTGTALWWSLSQWAEFRARGSRRAREILREDPDAEIDVGRSYWNDATERMRWIIEPLRSWDGIAIITAKGAWVSATGSDGNPLPRAPKVWTTNIQKGVPYDCNVHVRLTEGRRAEVIGSRSLELIVPKGNMIDLGESWSIDELIFDRMKLDPTTTGGRQITAMRVQMAVSDAKVRLVEAYQRAGHDEDGAREAAKRAWAASSLPSGKGAEIDPDALVALVEAAVAPGSPITLVPAPDDQPMEDPPEAEEPALVSIEEHVEIVRAWVEHIGDRETVRAACEAAGLATTGNVSHWRERLIVHLVAERWMPPEDLRSHAGSAVA